MTINKITKKKNNSSIQVLKTLQVLLQGTYSMKELVNLLNQKEEGAVFNNSVISKYINTCRYCGFEIPKINNQYYIAKVPFGLDLSDIDIELLETVQNYVADEMSSRCKGLIDSFCYKIAHFSNKKISAVEKKEFNYTIELFERAKAKKHKVKLIFKNHNVLECIPIDITQQGKKLFLNIFCKKYRSIDAARLSGIKLSGQRYIDPFAGDQTVIFKLSGNLAKRYEARENETVENNLDGTITVKNRNENKEMLFSRLLRYDDKCELIQPKMYRDDMKILIDEMLKNYGV